MMSIFTDAAVIQAVGNDGYNESNSGVGCGKVELELILKIYMIQL